MTVTTRETLMQRAMKGKPLMGQELRDLIDTMFWLKNSPVKESVQVVKQEAGRSSAPAPGFPDVDGTGFVKIGDDRKWYTDPTQYLTRPQGDVFYFRNALFPMDSGTYLAGDQTFKNFVDSARAAFTGGDGIDIVAGDVRVDSTVSRAGHIHDDRYYTETETDALIETRVPKHRFPINDDGTYNVVPSYANRQITLTPTVTSFIVWINGTKHTFTGAQVLPQHPNTTGIYFYFLNENGVFQLSTTPFELLKVAPVALVIWSAAKGEGRWVHEFHTTRMSARTHERLHAKGPVPVTGGFAMSGFTLNTDTPAAVSFGVAGGILWDEDIKHQIPALADGGPYEIWYRTGAAGDWTWDSVSTLPYKYGATYFTVNQIVTGAWTQVEINSGGVATWGNLFILATPHNGGVSIICVQGQNIYTDAASATAESWDALDKGGMPFPEYFALYRVTYKASVAYSGVTGRVRIEKVTSVAQGGESGVSGATVHNSLGGRDALDAHPALSITDIYNLANNSLLKKISTGIVAATASDLPIHASRHHFGGADPLVGQSIAGLRTTDAPVFNSISLDGNLWLRNAGTRQWSIGNGTSGLEIASRNSDGSAIDWPILVAHDAGGVICLGGTTNRPVNLTYSLQIGGVEVLTSERGGRLSSLIVTGQTTLATSLTGMLKVTAGVVSVAGAADVPAHATRHHWDGTDPITGQLLAGLLPNDVPVFSGLRSGSVTGYFPIRGNTGVEIARFNSSGFISYGDITLSGDLSIANLSGILYAANGRVRVAIGSDLPAHTHYTTDVSEGTNLWFTYQRARDAISGSHPMSVVNGVVLHADTDGYRHVPANGTTNSGKFLVSGGAAGSYTWETISAGSLPVHAFRHHYNGSDPLAGQSIAGLLVSSSPEFAGMKLGSLTGILKATAGVVSVAEASDLPGHASRHHWDGADPITGQSLSGLRTTDSPEFNRLMLGSEVRLKYSGVQEWGMVAGNSGFELASRNSDWSVIDWPVTIGHAAGGVIRLGGTTSRPVNLTYTLQMGGTTTINSSREGILTRLSVIKSLGTTIDSASRVDLLNSDSSWGQSFWSDSGGNLRLAFLQGDSTWTDRFKFMRTGAFQIGGVDAITSLRGGRFTDLIVAGQTTLAASLTGLLKATSGVISIAGASDLPTHTHLTTEVSEGTNLWFTTARAQAAISGLSPISVSSGVISHADTDGYKHVPANGTTNSRLFLQASANPGLYLWRGIEAIDLPSHSSSHHWDGSDPLAGQSIAGLLVTSSPTFVGMRLQGAASDDAYLRFYDNSGTLKHQIRRYSSGSGGLAIMDGASGFRVTIPSLGTLPIEIDGGLKVFTGDLTLNASFNGILKATSGVVSVVGAAGIDPGLVNVPYGRIPFGGSSGLTYSDKLRFNDPYTDMLWVDSHATFNGTVYANDLQLPLDGSIVSFSAAMIQFGDGVTVPRVLFPNVATNKAFQVDGLATFAHISAYLLEGDVQADRDEIESNGTRTLPAATTIGQEVRFCAGVGPSTYTVQVATPASEVIRYRSRTTGLPLIATSLDVVDSATTFVCHAVGRWNAIGY